MTARPSPLPSGISASAATMVGLAIAVLWAWLVRQPLWHTDLWGHLAYGRLIVENRGLPALEPFLEHSVDTPLVDSAWLSQVIGFVVIRWSGVAGLQLLFATLVTACAVLTMVPVCWPSRVGDGRAAAHPRAALAGAAVFLAAGWQQLEIIRPQLAGLVCFTALAAVVARPGKSRWRTTAVIVLMVSWANLHGSFVVGWLLLAAQAAGRICDRWRRTGCWSSVRRDRVVWRRCRHLVLGVSATLLTPHGLRLPVAVWEISRHPNLRDVIEWQPLQFDQPQARAMLVASVLIGLLAVVSRRRGRSADWLLLIGLGVSSLWTSRMLAWWAAVAGGVVAFHAAGMGCRRRHSSIRPGRFRPAITGLVVWGLAVGTAPATWSALDSAEPLVARRPAVSAATPVEVARWLVEHPPPGMVLAAYEWGDFLLWQGPVDLRVLVASHAHLIPPAVWQDYMAMIRLETGWRERLSKYDVKTVVLDRQRQAGLLEMLAEEEDWRRDYRDERCEVWSRNP
ncbi:MAG: hypothetical protein QF363_21780 [Planctomycetaceae bacterium]|nr:hypothetical protein [Planctomycetaceae bacterium]